MNVPRGQETETLHKKTRRGTGNKRKKRVANEEDIPDSWTREEQLDYAINWEIFADDLQKRSWNKASTSRTFDNYKKNLRSVDHKLKKCFPNEKHCRDSWGREEWIGKWNAPTEASRDIHEELDIEKDCEDSESRAIDERFVKVQKEFTREIAKRLAAKERANLRDRARKHQG